MAQGWGSTDGDVNTLFRKDGLPARPGRSAILMARRDAEAAVAARKKEQ